MSQIYVFDMGKVILKSANMKKMHHASQAECDLSTFNQFFYGSNKTTEVYKGIIEDFEFFQWIKEQTKSKKTPQELMDLYLQSKEGVYSDTIQIIQDLKRKKQTICLLSNLKQIDYDYLKKVVDLTVFDQEFLSFEMGMVKPDTEIYQAVIHKLGTNQFHFFDDHLENVTSAQKQGIDAHQTTGDTIKDYFTKIKRF